MLEATKIQGPQIAPNLVKATTGSVHQDLWSHDNNTLVFIHKQGRWSRSRGWN